MLVLTGTTGDVIHIGDDVKIHIVSSERGRVKIGFEAPDSVRILRDKVKDKIEKEGERR